MKKVHVTGAGALALAALAACAASGGDSGAAALREPEPDVSTIVDAEAPEEGGRAADARGPKELERCSPDGWCVTDLPNEDLDVRDIRPFESRAFAIAVSPKLGVQFLEWERSSDAWKYVSEGTQNQFDRGEYTGDIWAANENEVYFTLAPAFVYHGVRSNPASPFTWKISRLDDPDARPTAHDRGRVWTPNQIARPDPSSAPYDFFAPSLGVEGMPWGEVYAWYGPTLFRRTAGGSGEDVWVVEHTLTDDAYADDEFHIQSIAGGSPDDFWIGGVRSRVAADGVRERACPLAVQRRADGYHSFVDHVVNLTQDPTHLFNGVCDPKPGSRRLMGRFEFPGFDFVIEYESSNAGWVRSLHHIAPNTVVGLAGTSGLVYLKSDGDTPLARINDFGFVQSPIRYQSLRYNSLWLSESGAWASGFGIMLSLEHAPTAWSRGVGIVDSATGDNPMQSATFTLSSIARSGYPLGEPLHQVRGTSSSNLWAVGNRHAFHKTTP